MKISISGFYGSKNTGDEAILRSIIGLFKNTYNIEKVWVFTLHPENVTSQEDIEPVYRPNFGPKWPKTDFKRTIQAVRSSDVVVIGGGGLLQDAHSNITIVRYLQTALVAHWLNTPVVYLFVGIGPINNPLNRKLTSKFLQLANAVIVRDKESKDRVASLGVNQDSVSVSADPVFSLRSSNSEDIKEILNDNGITQDRPLLGVSVREFGLTEQRISELANFLDYLASTHNYRVVFIPFSFSGSDNDIVTSRKVEEQMNNDGHVLSKEYRPETIFGLVGNMDIVVGMRLHSVIMASASQTPVLGISYLPKVRDTLTQLGYEEDQYIKDLNELSEENLRSSFDNILNKEGKYNEKVEKNRRMVQESIDSLDLRPEPRTKYQLTKISLLYLFSVIILSISEFISLMRDRGVIDE